MAVINRRPRCTYGKILIMDSDKAIVKQLSKSLEKEGYKVECVEQKDKVFEKIKNGKVDVLILAVEGCGTKGYELIPVIKKINSLLPIIVTSTDDSIEVAARVREQGIFFYAIKPLDIKEIKLALKNALNRKFKRRYKPLSIHKEKVTQRDFEDEILDLAEVSNILKLIKKTVSKLAKKGQIPASKIGSRWFLIRNQLLEWFRITTAGNKKNYGTLILETMDEGVAVVDKRLRIVSCNNAYLQMLDVPRDRIIGEYCYRASHRSMVPCDASTCPTRQAFKTKRPVKFMHINYDDEGKKHYCDVIALPMKDKHGKVTQVLEVVRDNTEVYDLNKHLSWLMIFFAYASKKTLGSVVMNISALVDDTLSTTITVEKCKEMLLSSLCSLKLLRDMIRNYIISYKCENGTIQCRKKAVDINKTVLASVIGELRPLFYKKNMNIETEIRGDRPIYCDCDLMKIVFNNIINNATKYGTDGTKIQCLLAINDKKFELNILNEGIGIPWDKLNDVFDRFARFDKFGISGTGLGLHVVKLIAEIHNGMIKAESGYLIDDEPVTYDDFYTSSNFYKMKDKDLKKFARFIFTMPTGEEI